MACEGPTRGGLRLLHFLVWDHFNDQFAPLPALLAAADAISSLRIGTCVLANDYRHPVILAKEAATLDLLSEGRLELGIGAGWNQEEYRHAGIAFDAPFARVQRLEESVQIMKGLLAETALTFHGQYYTITNLHNHPAPVQKPHPPLMIGGARRQMLRLAAREADIVAFATKVFSDGTHDFRDSTGPAIKRKRAWVEEVAGARFAALEFHIHVGGVIITSDRQKKAAHLAETVGLTPPQLLDCLQALVGTEEEIVADLLERRKQFGISYISVDE